jgi:N-acetyl-alpha-D-muramate 1-phosphate uridylyltransferase
MKAMVFAAGRGERLRPLTDHTPKPLLPVYGKPLLDWHLEKLAAAGMTDVVINVSHLADKIIEHVGNGKRFGLNVQYSIEPIALEAGGGLATAAPMLGDGVIAMMSADIYSTLDYSHFHTYAADFGRNRAHWWFAPPHQNALGREFMLNEGHVQLAEGQNAHTWASIALIHSSLIANWPRGEKFKLLGHFEQWVRHGWVTGSFIDGQWENVTTAEDLQRLNVR